MSKATTVVRKSKALSLIRPEHPSWGMEPTFDRLMTKNEFADAMTWYSSNLDHKRGREILAQYLTNTEMPGVAKLVLNGGEDYFTPVLFAMARLMLNGATLPDVSFDRFKAYLNEGVAKYEAAIKVKRLEKDAAKYRSTRLNEKNVEILSIFEDAIENHDPKFDPSSVTDDKDLIAKIVEHYSKEVAAARKLTPTFDLTEQNKLDHITYIEGVIKGLTGDKPQVSRKPRKARAKKVVPAAKKVAKVQVRVEYLPLNIKSVPAEQIIGKQVLWFYDVKYGKLTKLVANDEAGLDVKGTTVLNYSEKTSVCKRAGRKAADILQVVLTGGKIARRKIFDDINTENTTVSGRLSENIVLLLTEK